MRKNLLALLALVSTTAAALAQSSTVPISGLPPAATPLSGSEIVAVVQSGATRRATVSNLFSARALTCSPHEWVSAAGSDGRLTCSQPGFADISGALGTGQLPTIGARTLLGNATGAAAAPQELPLAPLVGITRTQIPAATIGTPYKIFSLAGHSSVGDYGAGCAYTAGTSGGPNAIQDAAGNWFQGLDTGSGVNAGCFGQTSGDSTTAVQAALNAFNHVIISHDTKLGTVNITVGGKFIDCQSGAGIFANALATDVFNFHNDVAHPIDGGRVSGCRFFPDIVHGSQQTGGSYVVFENCFNCFADHLRINQPFNGIFVFGDNTNGINIDKVDSVGPAYDHIAIAGGVEIKITSTNMYGGSGHCGINLQKASGFYIDNTGMSNTGNALCMNPSSGGYVEFGFISNSVIGDQDATAVGTPMVAVDGSRISDINFVNNWSASSDTGMSTACAGSGIVKNITIADHRASTNFKSAIDLGCGSYIDISGKFGNNSYTSAGTYPAIKVRPGVDHWSVHNSTFATLGAPAYVQTQGWAIVVDAGSGSTYQIVNNDLSNGYTVAGIADNRLGANRVVNFNTPNTWDGPLPDGTTAITQAANDNSTQVATTAFVQSQFGVSQAWALSYPGLNTTLDGLAVRIGGFNAAWEFGGAGTGNYSTTGLVGAVSTPSGTYTGATPYWPDMGVAGYASTQTTTKSAVGIFGYAGTQVAGASILGGNTIAVNCNLRAAGCGPGGGLDFAFMPGLEADVNVFTKSGGGAPSGSASGFSAVFGGDVQPTGDLTGFRVNSASGTRFKFGFRSENGSADAGAKLGAAATSGPAASQPFQQAALNGASAELLGSAIINSAGDWVFTAPSGQTMSLNSAGVAAFSGPASVTAFTATALPASAGAGGLYVCVDTAGVFYKKAACP